MPPGHACRIVLRRPTSNTSSDLAGIDVIDVKSAPKEYFQEGPYAAKHDQRPAARSTAVGVPSLQLICLTKARELLEQREDWRLVLTDVMPTWRNHNTTYESAVKSRSIQHLLPGADADPSSVTPLKRVDPLTWALVIQLVPDLPSHFRCYEIALSDVHLPLLQHIPDSKEFCLITVLNLEGCSHLTDDTISNLKDLHGLVALNASRCMELSTTAIIRLRNALVRDEDDKGDLTMRGTWRLRILWLRGCRSLNSNVLAELEKFPLLSVVDLTGTGCYNRGNTPFHSATISQLKLYHPEHLLDATYTLTSVKGLFPSQNMFSIHIDQLHPAPAPTKRPHRPTVKEDDGFVVLSKNSMCHGRLSPEKKDKNLPTRDDRRHTPPGPFYDYYDDEDVLNYVGNPDERFDQWMGGAGEFSGESNNDGEDKSKTKVETRHAKRFYKANLAQLEADAIFLRKMLAFAPPKDAPAISDQRLNPLMLYRKPPPYTSLYTPPPHKGAIAMPQSDHAISGAPINRALPHVKAALESLGKVNKQLARKQVSVVRPADGFALPSNSDPKTPRNPFLAKSRRPIPDLGSTSAPSSSTPSPQMVPSDLFATTGTVVSKKKRIARTSSAAVVDDAAISALTPPSPEHESRPLRGISTLAVPLPPPTKKRPRISSKLAPAKKAKATTLDPALSAPSPKPKGTGLRPTTSGSLRQKMAEQQRRAQDDREEMLASERKERRKSTGSVKASSSLARVKPLERIAGGGLDLWLKRG